MKRTIYILALGPALLFGLLACGVTDTVLSNVAGGSKGNTVANLWPDVPPIPGAQKLSLDLPLTMQLAIQGMIKASASSSDVNLSAFDWIAFTTAQTPDQVSAFYSLDRMKAAGWSSDNQMGCLGTTATTPVSGGFCIFSKGQPGQKQSVLFIVPAEDNQTKQTQVFYVRLEGIVTATPTRSP